MKERLRSQIVDALVYHQRALKVPEGGLAHLLPFGLPQEEQWIIEKARVILAKRETQQRRFWESLCVSYPSYEIEE